MSSECCKKSFLAKRDFLNQRTLCKRGHWAALGFPGGSVGKESTCNAGDPGLIPGLGRSPGGGQPTPVFLPGESHGHRSLAGYRLWGRRVGHDWSKWAHVHKPLWALSVILASPITDFLPLFGDTGFICPIQMACSLLYLILLKDPGGSPLKENPRLFLQPLQWSSFLAGTPFTAPVVCINAKLRGPWIL